MKKTLAVLFLYMRVKAKGKYEYRAAFWLDALSFLFGYGAQTLLMGSAHAEVRHHQRLDAF